MNIKLELAEKYFYRAKNELCKPQEDVVPYSVCQSANHAVIDYLSSFLIEKDVEPPENAGMEELLKNCREIDDRFNSLHLAPLYHAVDTEDVWMNLDTANDFMAIAESTRQMVHGE